MHADREGHIAWIVYAAFVALAVLGAELLSLLFGPGAVRLFHGILGGTILSALVLLCVVCAVQHIIVRRRQ